MVTRALLEDVGEADLTAGLVDLRFVPVPRWWRARLRNLWAPWVELAFKQIDPTAELTWHIPEGHRCEADQVVVEVHGQARALADGLSVPR